MEKIWVFLHIIGFIFGAGGVTTAYARELYFKYHPEEAANRGSLRVVSVLINVGFILLILSGFGLYLGDPLKYNNSLSFQIKMGLVILLAINHVAINAFIRRQKHANWLLHAFAEYFSLLGWYLIIAVSLLI